ncbi:MAG: hypothetical protein ACYS9X_06590 [Planctomycetota bacterium]|jgi:hypothetical protein
MKGFLVSHGEKIAFVLVALVAGWSLFMSLTSLRATEVLPEADVRAIKKIGDELKTKKAPPKVLAPYGEWLGANLDGHGIYALAVGPVASPRVYEPPFMAEVIIKGKPVDGNIGLPSGLSAKGDRGKVTFSWSGSAVTDMRVLRYEVFRREEDGDWGAEAVYADAATTLVDKKVKPETEYAYKVRAVGVPTPRDDKRPVRPLTPPLVKQGEVWLTAFVGDAGNINAMTPSNIDFECSNVFNRFGEDYANIVIKRWNNEKDDWDLFRTEPGIKVGNKVVGTRRYGPGGSKVETFDSGYILKEIVDEVRTETVIVRRLVEDPPGSGNVVWKDVPVEVQKRVQEIVLEKEDGSQKLIVPVGKGRKKIEKKRDDKSAGAAARPTGAAGGIADLRSMFEKRAGGEERKTPDGTAAVPAAPAAPATVRLQDARTSVRLTFPAGWAVAGDMAADLGIGATGATLLNDGKVTAYKGTVAESGVVIADKPLNEDEKRRLIGPTGGEPDPKKEARLLATGLLRMDREILQNIEPRGAVQTRHTEAGKTVGMYAFAYAEGQDSVIVTKYCATSPGHLYVLSFVCAEKDFDSLQKGFNNIVYGWTW